MEGFESGIYQEATLLYKRNLIAQEYIHNLKQSRTPKASLLRGFSSLDCFFLSDSYIREKDQESINMHLNKIT